MTALRMETDTPAGRQALDLAPVPRFTRPPGRRIELDVAGKAAGEQMCALAAT